MCCYCQLVDQVRNVLLLSTGRLSKKCVAAAGGRLSKKCVAAAGGRLS